MQDDFGTEIHPLTVQDIRRQLGDGAARMTRIEDGLAENTAATEAIRVSTAELVEVFRAMQGALKVLDWLGRLARPMSYIVALAAAAVGLWSSIKGHK